MSHLKISMGKTVIGSKVFLDDKDITNNVTAVYISLVAGELPTVCVEVLPDTIVAEFESAQVSIYSEEGIEHVATPDTGDAGG